MTHASLNEDKLTELARILTLDNLSQQERSQRMLDCAGDSLLVKRAADWLPEAFGWVLLSHMPDVRVPTTFRVRDSDGRWHEHEFSKEPMFRDAVLLASKMAHSGSGGLFEKLALRSSMLSAVNSALNEGADIEGAAISGPAFVNLPAEIYDSSDVN